MPNEHNPVKCPWCGPDHAMEPISNEHPLNHQWTAYFMCGTCCAGTPNAYGKSEQEAIEAAYAAATRTPPNLPLTLKDMTEYDESDAVWVVSMDGNVAVVNGLDALEYAGYEYGALFFARKPSPADIEAARKAVDTDAR